MNKLFDVIIVGAGPAGLSAAVYCARKKISTALITKKVGGQLLGSSSVENYLGLDDETGIDISKRFKDHLDRYKDDLAIFYEEVVDSITKDVDNLEVKTNVRVFQAKNVIVASGRTAEKLNVEGEDKFVKKGVVYCATCDAPMFLGEDVVVAGGGNAALDAVLQLIEYANKIYLVDEDKTLKADEIQVERALSSGKVKIYSDTKIVKLDGDDFLKSVSIEQKGVTKTLSVGGLFVEIGSKANSSMVADFVETNEFGDIKIDKMCKTNIDGLYAAGDVTDVFGKQAIISAGEGAKASLAVYERLKEV